MIPATASVSLIDSLIRTSEHQELNKERAAILSSLRNSGLPSNKHEEYRFTPISRAIEKAFSEKEIKAPSNFNGIIQKPILDNCIRVIIRNGKIELPEASVLPEGLKIYKVLEKYIEDLCKPKKKDIYGDD